MDFEGISDCSTFRKQGSAPEGTYLKTSKRSENKNICGNNYNTGKVGLVSTNVEVLSIVSLQIPGFSSLNGPQRSVCSDVRRDVRPFRIAESVCSAGAQGSRGNRGVTLFLEPETCALIPCQARLAQKLMSAKLN